ncbi:tetratricopeptide repeat protein [Myxococcaceae bacterium GXIMD 01537]
MRSTFYRLLATAPLCALAACATTSATSAEVAALRAELRSMQESQSRLVQRLERIEMRDAVIRARDTAPSAPAPAPASSAAPPAPVAAPASSLDTPQLTVVKLKPKGEPAPSLATRVAVQEPEADDMEAFVTSGSASLSSAPAPRESPPQKDPAIAEAEYEQAMAALRTGNVDGGVARLRQFAGENPRHPRADNALYFAGLGLMGLKDHTGAAGVFERLIETYPAGDVVIDGILRLAECRQRLNQTDDARALYTRLVTQFPGTAAATQAEQRLASLSR